MYDQLWQDLESYKQESKKREEVLVRLFQSERLHLIVEIPTHSFDKGDSQTNEETKQDQARFQSKAEQTSEESNLKQQHFELKESQTTIQSKPDQSSNTHFWW